MKLKTWMKERGIKPKMLAKMFDKPVSVQSVRNWMSGTCIPTRHFAEISKITGNLVTANDFL